MSLRAALAAVLRPAAAGAPRCDACRSFRNDPEALAAAFPGLGSLASAAASVHAGDGLCARHGRHVRASARCAAFAAR